tara:strand:+ start:252 stop:461 length:210 start_codon:yes stop_codon:yes gene_type:complete
MKRLAEINARQFALDHVGHEFSAPLVLGYKMALEEMIRDIEDLEAEDLDDGLTEAQRAQLDNQCKECEE